MSLPGDILVQTLNLLSECRSAVKLLHSLARIVVKHQCFSQIYISEKISYDTQYIKKICGTLIFKHVKYYAILYLS